MVVKTKKIVYQTCYLAFTFCSHTATQSFILKIIIDYKIVICRKCNSMKDWGYWAEIFKKCKLYCLNQLKFQRHHICMGWAGKCEVRCNNDSSTTEGKIWTTYRVWKGQNHWPLWSRIYLMEHSDASLKAMDIQELDNSKMQDWMPNDDINAH